MWLSDECGLMPTFTALRLAILMPVEMPWAEGINLIENKCGLKCSLRHNYSLPEALFFSRLRLEPPNFLDNLIGWRDYCEDE